MKAKNLKIASLIITYSRVLEAKAQMDIIREAWQPMFGSLDIYHEFNGKKSWYPKKYREDFLHKHKTMPHFTGANYMLNQGIKHVLSSGTNYDFIIVTSADTWFFDPKKLKKIILTCHKKNLQLATSLWGMIALGTEFFIITPNLAKKVFPLRYTLFISKYKILKWTSTKIAVFESLFTIQIMRVLKNPNRIYLIPGRRTVWPTNRFHSPNFYASHHDQSKRKREILPEIRIVLKDRIENMPSLNKFLS
ncbi:hypothetical protein HYZ06_00545 [Candidatus Daviesbacteria bacterium]|nr:hypothetical protein [Candidatus Daviesbacteria bacterium]